jgi:Mor family transcriptional regulator
LNFQVEEKLAKKKKGALIAMSNCGADSSRHEYVRRLREHIDVTQVGECDGTVQCQKDPDGKALRIDMECMQNLNGKQLCSIKF